MIETKARRFGKAQAVNRWLNAEPENIAEVVKPIPAGVKGNRFAEDGVRITGSQAFVDAILGNLKSLLNAENGTSRLEILYQEIVNKETGLPMDDKWSCYIRVIRRGS